MSFEARLAELKITLPPAPKPVATYVPAVRAGDLLFLSGTGPFKDGVIAFAGKLGKDLTVEQGYEAARLTLLNSLARVRQELGTLDRVTRVVRLTGHVASAEGFTQQPAVINGASDLLVQIFGDAGRHARLALGAAELPLNMAIELELILDRKSTRLNSSHGYISYAVFCLKKKTPRRPSCSRTSNQSPSSSLSRGVCATEHARPLLT